MGLWDSIAIVLGFSVLVIVADELLHARRRKAKERNGTGGAPH